jgi:hypothetical protein
MNTERDNWSLEQGYKIPLCTLLSKVNLYLYPLTGPTIFIPLKPLSVKSRKPLSINITNKESGSEDCGR